MARNKTAQSPPGNPVASYKYPSKRKNIPPAGLAAQGTLQEAPKLRYEYNPHLPPTLRSAPDAAEADRLPEYLEVSRKRALTDNEARTLAAALRKTLKDVHLGEEEASAWLTDLEEARRNLPPLRDKWQS